MIVVDMKLTTVFIIQLSTFSTLSIDQKTGSTQHLATNVASGNCIVSKAHAQYTKIATRDLTVRHFVTVKRNVELLLCSTCPRVASLARFRRGLLPRPFKSGPRLEPAEFSLVTSGGGTQSHAVRSHHMPCRL